MFKIFGVCHSGGLCLISTALFCCSISCDLVVTLGIVKVCLMSLHSLLRSSVAATLKSSASILSGARSWEWLPGVVGGVRPLRLPGGVCSVVVAGQR